MKVLSLLALAPVGRFFRKIILSLFLTIACLGILSANVDSLYQAIQNTRSAIEKPKKFEALFKELDKTKDDRIPQFAEELMTLSEKENLDEGFGIAHLYRGTYFMRSGKRPEALEDLKKGQKHFKTIGDISKEVSCLLNISFVCGQLGKTDLELDAIDQAAEAAKNTSEAVVLGKVFRAKGYFLSKKGEYEEAGEFYDLAIEKYEAAGEEFELAKVLLNKGKLLEREDTPEAVKCLKKAIEIGEKLNERNFLLYPNSALVQIYRQQNDYARAVDLNTKMLKAAEEMGDITRISAGYYYNGDLYRDMDDFDAAIEEYKKSMEISEQNNYPYGVMVALGSIGITYRLNNQYENAIDYMTPALVLADSIGNIHLKMDILNDIGMSCILIGKIEKGRNYLEEALLLNAGKSESVSADGFNGLAQYFYKKKQLKKAVEYAEKANKIAEKKEFPKTQVQATQILYDAYRGLNNSDEALKWFEKNQILNDSINQKESLRKLTALRMSAKYEKEKQKTELDNQRKQELLSAEAKTNKIIAFCIGFLCLVGLGFLYNARRKNKIIAQKNDQLESLNHTKDRIFAIIGHDVRKPAISFRGISKVINYLIDNKDYERLQKVGTEIEKDALALYKLTDNLLNWALIQKDVIPHNPIKIKVAETAAETIEIFNRIAEKKNIKLTSNIPTDLIVFADPNALATIIRNLTDNALKYTPEGGSVTLNAIDSPEGTKIIIEDTGIGITEEKLRDIFLLQKDKSERGTAGEKGTGIGMHLIHELVKINHGKVEVKSAIGKGTKVVVMLPRQRLAAA